MRNRSLFMICVLIMLLSYTLASGQSINKTNTSEVTLIDVFDVQPENQQKVADIIIQLTEQYIKKQPGYISATIYLDVDGKKVFNIGKWKTQEEFQAILKSTEIMASIQKAIALSK